MYVVKASWVTVASPVTEMEGSILSSTVTVAVAAAVLPYASVALRVTVLSPKSLQLKLADVESVSYTHLTLPTNREV